MAQQLQNITVQAPGFAGINSEDSPLSLDQSFAATASNCIIDSSGRVGSRKGYTAVSTNNTVLGTSLGIEAVHESVDASGDKVVFAAGNNKIFKLGSNNALTDKTPSGYTINANNWKIVDFNNHTYFFQRGHAPLLYTDEGGIAGDGTLETVENHSHSTGTAPSGNEVLAAYGRLWVADIVGDKKTVHFSGLLSGHNWNSDGAGTLNLLDVLPNGDDEIVALAAHNGFLIIFCKRCIVVYSNAETITSIQLADTVEGVGCIARDSVQHTGTDILFLSDNGVRSFGRTIQEKSMPMRDISNNVRSELMQIVNQQTNPIKSLYSADEAFYLLSLSDSQTVYCFDMKQALPDGANRVTTWSGINPRSMTVLADKSIYFGRKDGIFKYGGYTDDGESYQMLYYSNPLNFGNSTNLKFLKKFNITVIGNVAAQTTLAWGYDYNNDYNKKVFSTEEPNTPIAEYNIAEFGDNTTTLFTVNDPTGTYLGEFSSAPTSPAPNATEFYYNTTDNKLYQFINSSWSEITAVNTSYVSSLFTVGTDIQRPSVNTNGSGSVVTIGIESTINNAPYSIQQIDVHALLGRLI